MTRSDSNEAFLVLALRRAVPAFARLFADQGWVGHILEDIPLLNVPGVGVLTCYLWPSPPAAPSMIEVDVVARDGVATRDAVSYSLDIPEGLRPPPWNSEALRPPEEPHPDTGKIFKQLSSGYLWRYVPKGAKFEEWSSLHVKQLRQRGPGSPVSLWMNCPMCGRARYAQPQGAPLILECRTCQNQTRRRRRLVALFREKWTAVDPYAPSTLLVSRPSAARRGRILTLYAMHRYTLTQIAALVDCGVANVSRTITRARSFSSSGHSQSTAAGQKTTDT